MFNFDYELRIKMNQSKERLWNMNLNVIGRSDYDFFETENEKYGICFSKISEYNMMRYVSPVEIWTDKANPKKIFESNKIKFEYQFERSCYYFEQSNLIALLMPCQTLYNDFELLYILIDIDNDKCATINHPNFDLIQINKDEFRLKLNYRYYYDIKQKSRIATNDGMTVVLNKLNWIPIKNLAYNKIIK